jgi:hypothetical protein
LLPGQASPPRVGELTRAARQPRFLAWSSAQSGRRTAHRGVDQLLAGERARRPVASPASSHRLRLRPRIGGIDVAVGTNHIAPDRWHSSKQSARIGEPRSEIESVILARRAGHRGGGKNCATSARDADACLMLRARESVWRRGPPTGTVDCCHRARGSDSLTLWSLRTDT